MWKLLSQLLFHTPKILIVSQDISTGYFLLYSLKPETEILNWSNIWCGIIFLKLNFFPGQTLITLQRLLCQGYQGSKWDCFDHLSKNLSFFQSPCPAQFAPFCFVLQLLIKWFVKDQHTNCFSFVFVGSFVKGGTAHEEAEILRKQSFF